MIKLILGDICCPLHSNLLIVAALDLDLTAYFWILLRSYTVIEFFRVGRLCLCDDNRWQEGFFWALCLAAGDALASPPRGPAPSSFSALSCLKNFAGDEDLYERTIKQVFFLNFSF